NKTLVVGSGEIKGRLHDDKYIFESIYAKKYIWWSENGSDNKRFKRKNWKLIKQRLCQEVVKKDLFVVDGFYNHDERYSMAVSLITTPDSAAAFCKLIS
ncbi:phosphoenolpyruvate carboxykinase (ATP), partial [Francisella tularensis subsp. holarctica]|uniref:phosphoenolpyruvate carboxykinase (ATP) n=1 Tax=Francisella tularensis TaxID=263 RepID=UPI002381B898